jgi:hypothetical protein
MDTRIAMLITAIVLAVIPVAAAADDPETVRRELTEMRRQFETMQQQYQKAIESLTERLQRLETRPTPVVTAPSAPTSPPAPSTPAAAQAPPATASRPLTPGDLVRPRQPFSLYERRGIGQLLFDIGVAGDFVGNITQDNVDEANAGTFAGRENRFFPREIELSLFGQIDPYARGEVRIEAAEEFEDGERELHLGLAEAHLTLLTLPYGLQAKLGFMRNRFGLMNQLHLHDRPQIDSPQVLLRFFGEEGLRESGGELTWVPPLPFYLEVLAGLFNGDNEEAFGAGNLKRPLVTGRLRTFFELTDEHAIQLGASVASGRTGDELRNTIVGADLKYKYRPDGWRWPLLTVGGEALFAHRRTNIENEVEVDTDDDGIPDSTEIVTERRTRDRFGWYAWSEIQPWQRWAFGLRYDSTQFPLEPGREWAITPYLVFSPSEFLRFRAAYKRTERDRSGLFAENGGSARIVDELLLQATFLLGAHPAHPF